MRLLDTTATLEKINAIAPAVGDEKAKPPQKRRVPIPPQMAAPAAPER